MLDFRGKGYILAAARDIKSNMFNKLFCNFSELFASVQ